MKIRDLFRFNHFIQQILTVYSEGDTTINKRQGPLHLDTAGRAMPTELSLYS